MRPASRKAFSILTLGSFSITELANDVGLNIGFSSFSAALLISMIFVGFSGSATRSSSPNSSLTCCASISNLFCFSCSASCFSLISSSLICFFFSSICLLPLTAACISFLRSLRSSFCLSASSKRSFLILSSCSFFLSFSESTFFFNSAFSFCERALSLFSSSSFRFRSCSSFSRFSSSLFLFSSLSTLSFSSSSALSSLRALCRSLTSKSCCRCSSCLASSSLHSAIIFSILDCSSARRASIFLFMNCCLMYHFL